MTPIIRGANFLNGAKYSCKISVYVTESLGIVWTLDASHCSGCWLLLTHKDKAATHAEWEDNFATTYSFIDSLYATEENIIIFEV